MKKFLILIGCFLPLFVQGQQFREDNNKIRLSFDVMTHTPPTLLSPEDMTALPIDKPSINGALGVEWSRTVNPWLEVGLYATLKRGALLHQYGSAYSVNPAGDTVVVNSFGAEFFPAVGFGATGRLHLLSNTSSISKHWDFYAVGRLGGWVCNGIRKEYGLGLGVNYYPFAHLGIFSECSFGQTYAASPIADLLKGDATLRLGLIWSF